MSFDVKKAYISYDMSKIQVYKIVGHFKIVTYLLMINIVLNVQAEQGANVLNICLMTDYRDHSTFVRDNTRIKMMVSLQQVSWVIASFVLDGRV